MQSWEKHGQRILADSNGEMLNLAHEIASAQVQVMTHYSDFFFKNTTNFGALFLGAGCNVAYGDRVIGSNHTWPTLQAALWKACTRTEGCWTSSRKRACAPTKPCTAWRDRKLMALAGRQAKLG